MFGRHRAVGHPPHLLFVTVSFFYDLQCLGTFGVLAVATESHQVPEKQAVGLGHPWPQPTNPPTPALGASLSAQDWPRGDVHVSRWGDRQSES